MVIFNELNSNRQVYISAITIHGGGRENIWTITQTNDTCLNLNLETGEQIIRQPQKTMPTRTSK